MQSWVNSQLAGYYTIAEVDALLAGILQTIDENHTDILAELKSLSVALNTMKTNIIALYEKAIAAAITDNNGVIDAKIQAEISAVNSRIDDKVAIINDRIKALEARINDLENAIDKIRSLDIEFDIDDIKKVIQRKNKAQNIDNKSSGKAIRKENNYLQNKQIINNINHKVPKKEKLFQPKKNM